MTEQVSFQFRRGLSGGTGGWTSANPVLKAGEPGFELDTTTLKIGDGTSTWYNLGKFKFGSEIAIGKNAGTTNQGTRSIAIGQSAGSSNQGSLNGIGNSIAMGFQAGSASQGYYSIAIGDNSGGQFQGNQAVAIGHQAGTSNQGDYSIAIGAKAGINTYGISGSNPQASKTIILNASGLELDGISGQTGSCYIAPVRNTIGVTGNLPLSYDTQTKEVTTSGLSGTVITGSILPSQDGVFNLGSPTQRFQTVYATTASISTNTLNMTTPGSTGTIPSASISFHGGIFLFADHSSGILMSIGPGGFQLLDYNSYYGPTGIFGPPDNGGGGVTGATGVTGGESGVTGGETGVTGGESGVTGGETGVTGGEFSPYDIISLIDIDNGTPSVQPAYIVDGGYPGSTFYYIVDGNTSQIIYF